MEFESHLKNNNSQIISEDPLIKTIDNFLDNETCTHFINIAKDKLQQALVCTNKQGVVSKGRTGKNCWIDHNYDQKTLEVATRIASVVGLPLQNAEKYQFIYYDKNQEYRSHMDSWDHDDSDKSKRCMRLGGQRMFTALGYLNNVLEGGETHFTKKNISVPPTIGKLLIFQMYLVVRIKDIHLVNMRVVLYWKVKNGDLIYGLEKTILKKLYHIQLKI